MRTLLIAASLLVAQALSAAPPEADREAILSMAGEYEVLFNFEETVGLLDGYVLKEPYQEEATETIVVIEDSGDRIALQHLLQVGGGRVIKHWKQIWTWQDTRLLAYEGRDEWRMHDLSPEEVEGTWSQLVTQVDDSPRYESYGHWHHVDNLSEWSGAQTARPLPRREHTTRDDYDILFCANRHALTPHGWVHEQDSVKYALPDEGLAGQYLVRERGVNHYDVLEGHDFSPARDYWDATQDYWSDVSAIFEEIMETHDHFAIAPEVGGQKLWQSLFDLADPLTEDPEAKAPSLEEIRSVIDSYVEPKS